MNYVASPVAIVIFLAFVGFVLGLSFYYARKARSASGYLSAASFLGICGMIATMGFDGFLYSIGCLAGWIVALFVVAEPMKRLGKYTFTDALDSTFNSKGIQMMAAISTLAVSIFYLIPQMVGAGVLVTPLLGLPHWAGVIMVGAVAHDLVDKFSAWIHSAATDSPPVFPFNVLRLVSTGRLVSNSSADVNRSKECKEMVSV